MSNSDTWMPLHVSRYLGDTGHLTVAEHGAYLLLLMQYWVRGPLPDDDRQLAIMAKTDPKAWRKGIGQTLRQFFTVHDDGLLHQKRADAELATAGVIIEKKRSAANARWGSDKRPPPSRPNGVHDPNSAHPDAMHMHSGCTPDGVQAQSECSADAVQTQCPLPVPKPSKNLSFFKEGEEAARAYAPAREEAPSEAAVRAARRQSAADVSAMPAPMAEAVRSAASSMRNYSLDGQKARQTVNEQREDVAIRTPVKPAYLSREQLQAARRQQLRVAA
jgi:uncharacterized protein YdaU (DUF1376 family)